MYKLLIVDDNYIIRNALRDYIDWNQIGFQITGEAANGVEALNYIRNSAPHAILLDIRMPVMSGLELMDILKTEKMDIYVVILSAYDEFSYAKKALEIGAVDYILKPFNKEKINEIFSRIKDDLDSKTFNQLHINELVSMKSDKTFGIILKGKYGHDLIINQFKEIGIEPAYEKYAIICMKINKFILSSNKEEIDIDQINDNIKTTILELFSGIQCCKVYTVEPYQITILLGYNGSSDEIIIAGRRMIFSINNMLLQDIKLLYKCDIPLLSDIPRAYKEIQELLQYRLYFKQNHMNDINQINTVNTKEVYFSVNDITDRVVTHLSTGEYLHIYELLDYVFVTLKNGKRLLDEEVYMIFTYFTSGIRNFIEQANIDAVKVVEACKLPYNEFLKFNMIDDINEALLCTFKDVSIIIDQYREQKNNKIIEEAKNYIVNHYHEEISLNNIAKHLYIHPVYFCTMFKKETGVNFNEYLTQIRLNKALELIKNSDIKIYEISNAVGYKSSKHFSRLFKSHFGFMPKDYRNKIILK